MDFKLPYIYDFIAKLCRQQAEDIQNYENANLRNIGQDEVRQRLKLGGGQVHDRSSA
jgi:hypothetical protein